MQLFFQATNLTGFANVWDQDRTRLLVFRTRPRPSKTFSRPRQLDKTETFDCESWTVHTSSPNSHTMCRPWMRSRSWDLSWKISRVTDPGVRHRLREESATQTCPPCQPQRTPTDQLLHNTQSHVIATDNQYYQIIPILLRWNKVCHRTHCRWPCVTDDWQWLSFMQYSYLLTYLHTRMSTLGGYSNIQEGTYRLSLQEWCHNQLLHREQWHRLWL